MEPNLRGVRSNPGVTALTVVNRGKPPTENPFQWISGRRRSPLHLSPMYRSLRGAKGWRSRANAEVATKAKLYAVDEYGNILTGPVSKKLLQNKRRSEMAYNIGALRRAMQANTRSGVSEFRSAGGATIRNAPRKKPGIYTPTGRVRKGFAEATYSPDVEFGPGVPSTIKHHRYHRAGLKGAQTRAAKKQRRSLAAKKAWATRKRNAAKKTTAKKTTAKKSSKKKTVRGTKRRMTKQFFHGKRLRRTGREYIDKYLLRGLLPSVTRAGRMPLSRSGRPAIWTYPISQTIGRTSKSRTVRGSSKRGYAIGATYRGRKRRRMTQLAANIAYALAGNKRGRRGSRKRSSKAKRSSKRSKRSSKRRGMSRNQRYVVMNKRRGSKRRGSKRSSSGWLYANRRRSSRRSSRRNSRHRMTRNMLAVSKVKYRGSGSSRMGRAQGRLYQLVEYGPKSGKYKRAGYPVLVPPHVSMHGYVRKFRFGGAAKDAHAKAKAGGYSEKKYSRWRKVPAWFTRRQSRKAAKAAKMTSNKRRGTRRNRRSSMRRNQKYVLMNRHRRGMHRNVLGGADLMKDVLTPVIGGTVGFVAARVLSNSLAGVEQVRNVFDRGQDAAGASNTKIVGSLVGIAATLGLSTKVNIIRQNRGALVTGMGLALTDRLIQRFSTGTPAAAYLGEYGEYVEQPMSGLGIAYAAAGVGEYVDQPLSGPVEYATAGVGEYVEGPDPANQDDVDSLMNVMEAAAGFGVAEAAAGMGATMGSGEADAQLAAMYARRQPPFVSTTMPVDGALLVTKTLPLDKPVRESLVTPEGKGYAGGLFARHLFAGMMGS